MSPDRRIPGVRVVSWILFMLVGTLACVSPPPRTLILSVSNELDRNISEIWQKPCDAPESGLAEIEDSRLRPGQSRGFVLPPACLDLLAFDDRGRLVGQQRDFSMLPGARWVLRN